ncbi:MAG: hypothetical protein HF981_00580 [Desulfobacteraceae bacterium]|nr:hypothetical protein [Desulfobacteraceae bacterium]MBC2748863.1 hypothetical protein [Desulfobacteraceae bacterium]
MTDQHPPHDPSEPENNDGIIELTDVVAMPETTDDDIIELTDVVARDAGDDDGVIELTDVVQSPPSEEPIIELTEVVSPVDRDVEEAMAETRGEEPEEVPPASDVEESTSGELAFAEMELDIEDHTDDELFDSMGMNLEADLLPSSEDNSELDFNLSTQELSDAIDLLDAKLAEEPPQPPTVDEPDIQPAAMVGQDQLEAALENVIKKMVGDKIDHLLNDAIEKSVSAEIARLKEQLLGDHPEKP